MIERIKTNWLELFGVTPIRALRSFPVRALLLVCLLSTLAACSSAEQDNPETNSELATFRLTDVWTETSNQASLAATTKIRRRITFFTTVKDVATTDSLQANVGFRVLLGSKIVGTPSTTINGIIKWELEEEFEKDEVLDYKLYVFRIEAGAPYSGFRVRRIKVNFQKEGAQAGIDVTDGQRDAPSATVPTVKIAAEDGTLENPKPNFYPIQTTVASHNDIPYAISRATGKRNQLSFQMRTCMLKESEQLEEVRTGLSFSVETKAIMDEDKVVFEGSKEDVSIVSDGCFYFPLHMKTFSFFSAQRWYPIETKICSENDSHGDRCIDYIFYFNPWRRFNIGSQDYVFNQGHSASPVTKFISPANEFIHGSKQFEALAELRKPKLFAKGYSATFLGRTYRIDEELNMSSVRRYQFVMEPQIQHWTIDNPSRSEDLNTGSVRVKLLLRKSHGDSIHEFPISNKSETTRLKESECFASKSIFDLPKDRATREWCYSRSFMDYQSKRVKVEQGVLADIFHLEFEDIRFVTSRNILMMELSLDLDDLKEEGIEIGSQTFVSSFSPLSEDAYRRWSKQYDQYFEQPNGERTRIAELDYIDTVSAVYRKSMTDAGLGDAEELQRFLADLPNQVVSGSDGVVYNAEMDQNVPYSRDANITYEALEVLETNRAGGSPDAVVMPRPETIEQIMKIVTEAQDRERYGDNYVDLRTAAEYDSKKNGLPVPVNIYRIKNSLEAKNTEATLTRFPFDDRDFDIIIDSRRSKIRPDQQPSQNLGFLNLYKFSGTGKDAKQTLSNHELKEVLDTACDAIYPTTQLAEVDREAQLAADIKRQRAEDAYFVQRQILCEMHDMIAAKIYDDIELDDTQIRGNCEEMRPLCFRPMVEFKDTGANMFERGIYALTGVFGESESSPELSCDKGLEKEEIQQLSSLFRGDLDLVESITEGTMHWIIDLVEPLARKWLRHAPFAKIRDEVLRRNNPNMRLDEILIHPDEQPDLYKPVRLNDRCKRDPFRYLNIDITKHVTSLKNANHERYAKAVDVTNLNVSASITIVESDQNQEVHGTSRSSMVINNIDTVAAVNGYLWGGLTISGNGFQTALSAASNIRKAAQTHKNWFLRQVSIDSSGNYSRASNATSKTINAEYATFELEVQTMQCVSIRPKWYTPGTDAKKLTHPGFLLCGEPLDPLRDEYETIEETWYYTYLYFRNNNSGLTNTATSLVERPWTVLMRGEQLFEVFRDTLADKSTQLELESRVMPDPQIPLRQAYREFRDMRDAKFLNSPGLIKRLVIIPQEPPQPTPYD